MNLFRYVVYIVKCSDNSYYTGITNNLDRRLYEHNTSDDDFNYTFSRGPVVLVYYELFNDVKQVIAFEKKITGWTRKKKEALIENKWSKLPELSICKNTSSHLNYKLEQPFDSAQGDRTA